MDCINSNGGPPEFSAENVIASTIVPAQPDMPSSAPPLVTESGHLAMSDSDIWTDTQDELNSHALIWLSMQ